MDYQAVIDILGEGMKIALPLGITLGVIEKLINMFLDCALDRGSRKERL